MPIGPMISIEGAVDLHIHSHPCLFPRIASDRQMAESAAAAGLSAIMLKCHHESTVGRAFLLDEEFPDLRIFGGIVLNNWVGGINPEAVEAALESGAKEVWLPTVHARYHGEVHGGTGRYDVQAAGGDKSASDPISVVVDGKATEDVIEVFELVAKYDAILGTCHQSPDEIKIVAKAAQKRGVQKVLITHPFFKAPSLTPEDVVELTKLGAIAEFGYCTISPMWAYANVKKIAETIKRVGADRCVIISDGGQRHNPMPPEGLRILAQCLYESGVAEQQLDQLMVNNPKQLLGLA